MNLGTIMTLMFGAGGFITGGMSLYSIRSQKKKTDSETGVNASIKQKNEAEAIALNESTEEKREEFWNKKFEDNRKEFEDKLNDVYEELSWMRVLIENHVPWDWEVQRLLIQNGIEHKRPPSLNYIKSQKPKINIGDDGD